MIDFVVLLYKKDFSKDTFSISHVFSFVEKNKAMGMINYIFDEQQYHLLYQGVIDACSKKDMCNLW